MLQRKLVTSLLLALLLPLVLLTASSLAGPAVAQDLVVSLGDDTCGNDCILASCATNITYCDRRHDDCLMQLCSMPAAPPDERRQQAGTAISCTAGDPVCDEHAGDKICGFHVSLCFNVGAAGQVDPIERVKFRRPSQDNPVHSIDVGNRDAIEAALVALGGEIQGKCHNRAKRGLACSGDRGCDSGPATFDGRCMRRSVVFAPPLASARICTPLFRYEVQLRFEGNALAFGRSEIRIRAQRSGGQPGRRGVEDDDMLRFTCLP